MYKEPVFQGVPGHGDWNPNNDVYCSDPHKEAICQVSWGSLKTSNDQPVHKKRPTLSPAWAGYLRSIFTSEHASLSLI